MAKATQIDKENVVAKMVRVEERVPYSTIALELTAAEALTLRTILRHVGGSPNVSVRKFQESILAAICSTSLLRNNYHLHNKISESIRGGAQFPENRIFFKEDSALVADLEKL